jgi:hypothetical protein
MFFRRGVRGAYGSVVTRYPLQNNASHHQQPQKLIQNQSPDERIITPTTTGGDNQQSRNEVALMSRTDKIKYMFNIK